MCLPWLSSIILTVIFALAHLFAVALLLNHTIDFAVRFHSYWFLSDLVKIYRNVENMMMSCYGNTFRITGPLWGESTSHQLITPYKGPSTQSLGDFCLFVSLNKLFNKQSSCQILKTPWWSCLLPIIRSYTCAMGWKIWALIQYKDAILPV